ncbi:hypothetical protein VTN00DRAFT_5628 [Thermoascus crustaceus]|uniref:uncharacterized protein n=1 Tax=Thermoascus crustaceus TaxID=5088 RepID=UPI003743BA0D
MGRRHDPIWPQPQQELSRIKLRDNRLCYYLALSFGSLRKCTHVGKPKWDTTKNGPDKMERSKKKQECEVTCTGCE